MLSSLITSRAEVAGSVKIMVHTPSMCEVSDPKSYWVPGEVKTRMTATFYMNLIIIK